MTSRTIAFLVAAATLVSIRATIWRSQRRGTPFFAAAADEQAPVWRPGRLLLASVLTLFAELAFIRWISVEVRIFAYFKNLALLLCFLGFGLGCALVKQKPRWSASLNAFLGLLLIVRIPWGSAQIFEGLSQSLGGAADVGIWVAPAATDWPFFLVAMTLAACLFILIASVFVPLGQIVSRQTDQAPSSLRAYSWNLLGSVIGVAAFLLVSRFMLPPPVWMGAVLLGFAFLQQRRRDVKLLASLLIPLVLVLHEPAERDRVVLWTPYQQIQYTRHFTPAGELWGGVMDVNHTLYQRIVDLSSQFLTRHPELQGEEQHNPYNLPFRFAVPFPKVLVVGSGTGNDVAAALRHGSTMVDAVEIDPAILQLGKREHPERPYDSPRVNIHLTDARNFLKRTPERYDLILFGLLDSHSQFSDYSNMRIDNFVYTEEAFREAVSHLKPDGVIFVKFEVNRPWLAARLSQILRDAFGRAPLIFPAESRYSVGATCFVDSRSHRVDDALAQDAELADFVRRKPAIAMPTAVPVTTDDWPYLYQRDHKIPRTYFSVSILVILISLVLCVRVRRMTGSSAPFSLFFFAMGAGFLLLETQIISRLALFFGTVWQVNGIVITALLLALLLANVMAETVKLPPQPWIWAGLLASLAIAYWFPFGRIAASPETVGLIAIVVFSVPVLFAGILFSTVFGNTASPSSALNANVLGAVSGGLLENLSLLFGLRALLFVAIALYCIAGFALWRAVRNPGKSEIASRWQEAEVAK